MNLQELGQKIKVKYPQYKNIDDIELAKKIIQKYPTYKSQISDNRNITDNSGLLNKTAKLFSNTFGKASDVLFGSVAPAIGSVIGSGVESAKEMITGKPSKRVFTKEAEQRLGTPLKAVKTLAASALDLTTAGLGEKAVAKVAQISKKPITLLAEKLYQSALKPKALVKSGKVITEGKDIAKIGLDERVWLTKGGVERVSNKIDEFEEALGAAINEAKNKGTYISTKGLKSYLNEAKTFFSNQFNTIEAEKAIKEIDQIGKGFKKKYGTKIPIEKAQEVKVATGQALKRYYNSMSSAGIEGTKQGVRYLKDEIVKNAPAVKNINERLRNLYTFDQALSKASGRIGNLNLLGLPSKIAAGVGGGKGFIVGKLLEIADAPAIKSGAAIGLNELSKGAEAITKSGRVPVSVLINNIIRALDNEDID